MQAELIDPCISLLQAQNGCRYGLMQAQLIDPGIGLLQAQLMYPGIGSSADVSKYRFI